ncbi:hypothetical protein V2J09_018786 [Rumex salicifolius]
MKKHCISISFYFTFFIVLSIPLSHRVCCSDSSSPDTVTLQGRIPRKLLSTYQSNQIVEEETWKSKDSEDGDESVYHLDYHGVKTHPSPTPKCPTP